MSLSQDSPHPSCPSNSLDPVIPCNPSNTHQHRRSWTWSGENTESVLALSKSIVIAKRLSSPILTIESGSRPTKRAREEGTMEEIGVDSFWPYQVGGPGLLPSPLNSGRYLRQSEVPRGGNEAVTRVRELCARLGVEVHCVEFVERSDKTPGADMQLSLQLLVPASPEDQNNTNLTPLWKRLCIEAYQLLLECDLGQVQVHVVDLYNAKRAFRFPTIANDAAIVNSWETLRPVIHASLSGHAWHTLSVSGEKSNRQEAVITVSVWEPREKVWQDQRECIRRICASNGITVNVVIAQAYSVFFTAKPRSMTEFAHLQLGASLELKDDKSAGVGTSGGHFLLSEDGKEPRAVGLTCYHVIRGCQLIDAGGFPAAKQIHSTDANLSPIFSSILTLSPFHADDQLQVLTRGAFVRKTPKHRS